MNIILSRIVIVCYGPLAVFLSSTFEAFMWWLDCLKVNWEALKRMWRDGIE